MNLFPFPGDSYETPEGAAGFERFLPSFFFALNVADIVRHDGHLARSGLYGGKEWVAGSTATVRALERCGVRLRFCGMGHIDRVEGPCVFVGNHMSTLETFVLPSLINPRKTVTFVVKDSLLRYPWFGPVLQSRDPIVVRRKNPREDFATVLEEGIERLGKGISLIVFPQSTRTPVFDPAVFNSIAVKLARRADVPLLPVALRTDAWRNGKYIKDYGGLCTEIRVSIRFGEALRVSGNGKREQAQVCEFISARLADWGLPGKGGELSAPERDACGFEKTYGNQ
ncbi:MAG: 1-acyl-sn-glycerol-3-phosphate acyltransferase [Desulfovibrio sp.]|nr:1-acyl-sn-glycerol-3-phosphate acyltransferase [Desulfovibrio sp.]